MVVLGTFLLTLIVGFFGFFGSLESVFYLYNRGYIKIKFFN